MARRFLLVALLAALLVTAQAHAARAASCGRTPGLVCFSVDVPLDRSGHVPGTISLHVERLPANGFQRGVAFLIAGGPGQGSAQAFNLRSPSDAAFLRFIMPGYELVAVDNRGTGSSGVLRCPALQASVTASAEKDASLVADCAATIGEGRQFYATRDHAEDLEAVRQALGVDRIALAGVSYGTKLALAYALAHPGHVERLLLDSVVPTTLPDPFETNVLQNMPATLATYCPGNSCRAATRDFAGEFVTLVNALEAHPVRAKVLVAGGKTRTIRMTGEDLISASIDADLNPGLAAELPAAVHDARGGNYRPLFRLYDLDTRSNNVPPKDLSAGLYAATTCDDGLFPWSPGTPIADRPALIDAAIAALPPGALGPFGTWAARTGSAVFCKLWPSPAGRAPLGPGPLPNVPVLAISGGLDLRTPTASAAKVAALFPQGHLLVVPGVGHSVLTADLSFCAQNAVRSWLLGGPVLDRCPRVPPLVTPVGTFPRRAPAHNVSTTLHVAAATLHEAEAAWLQAPPSGKVYPSGLFGGRLIPGKALAFRLVRYSLAPGVTVTGKLAVVFDLPFRLRGTVSVGGPAAVAGKLRVRGLRVSGVLGGRRVSAHL